MTNTFLPVCMSWLIRNRAVGECLPDQKLMVRSDWTLTLPFESRVSCQMCAREDPSPLCLILAVVCCLREGGDGRN